MCTNLHGSIQSDSESPGFPVLNFTLPVLAASLGGSVVKNLPADAGEMVRSLHREDPLEEDLATHSSILVWEIPRTEEPGRLQSMRSQRVGHDRATAHAHTHWQPETLETRLL